MVNNNSDEGFYFYFLKNETTKQQTNTNDQTKRLAICKSDDVLYLRVLISR